MTAYGDVLAARERVVGRVRRTPVVRVEVPTGDGELEVDFKLEFLQHTGSFKARGMVNAVLAARERGALGEAGVVIASGGNAGLAAAWAARLVGCPATVVVPVTAPAAKVAQLHEHGAEVVQHGAVYAEAYEEAARIGRASGALPLHAYDLPEVVAGAGTIGVELVEDLGDAAATVLIAVGGGGLVAGVASAVPDSWRVVGVEPAGCPTLRAALTAGEPVRVEVDSVAQDALGASVLGALAFEVATAKGVESALVADEEILEAKAWLWQRCRIVVEPSGATALAGLMSGAVRVSGRAVVVLCGANTSLA
ncbi:serine/threonine dehydratase [Segniliparus rugosus]|uniref:Tryptophan synthase beta chain-like PALP domain-containing protein n=1 Tax=Segniliparus rugosus (strain ATCC BAA-974 / DSM 45345 / CCUG 50838 / CIP 108380 / JCM 13579 / CDC 945) TaxID=679197 RepID=E5XUH7_SEGRC|nr:serine/threonine dehydratase [Segniliparus rugosus]EFV12003.2 hypothetical protein HMPREF9336_03149 [Segniliparus rugosus ATCC BAA-974]